MRLQKALWLFPTALALHNLEEAIWLPAWSQHAGFWKSPVGTTEFRVAAVLLTIAAYGVTYWSARAGKETAGTYVMAGFVFAILLNVIFHVAATIGLREYAPGVVTAVLINLPVMPYLLQRLFRERWVSWPKTLLVFVGVPIAIFILIPILLWIGRSVEIPRIESGQRTNPGFIALSDSQNDFPLPENKINRR
jgi:hypothetical protein